MALPAIAPAVPARTAQLTLAIRQVKIRCCPACFGPASFINRQFLRPAISPCKKGGAVRPVLCVQTVVQVTLSNGCHHIAKTLYSHSRCKRRDIASESHRTQ